MLTLCPEIKGGNYIAVQRGGRREPSLCVKSVLDMESRNDGYPKVPSDFPCVIRSHLLEPPNKWRGKLPAGAAVSSGVKMFPPWTLFRVAPPGACSALAFRR